MQLAKRTSLLLLTCMAVLGATLTSVASAHEYSALKTPAKLSGTNGTFVAGEATIKCGKQHLEYTGAIGKFRSIDLVPTFSECYLGEEPVTVIAEKLLLELGTPTEVKANEFSVPLALVGEAGAKLRLILEIEGESCEGTVAPQESTDKGTKFLNSGSTSGEVKAKIEVKYKSAGHCAGILKAEGLAKYEGNTGGPGLIVE